MIERTPARTLAESDRAVLLSIARRSIEAAVTPPAPWTGSAPDPVPEPEPPAEPTAAICEPGAAFVTIHEAGELRGCIGLLRFEVPLWENVRDAAAAAALDDPRFVPVEAPELERLDLEVSVLEPPVPLADPGEFVAGRDGIVVERGGRQALLLPQVATEMGWGAEQMLDAVCRKAHLPGNAWRDPETRLYVFRSVCFGER